MAKLDLDDVYEEIRADKHWDHLRDTGIVLVPGRGQTREPDAMIVGEAPGATENTKRRVFCGPSGRVLDRLMMLAGLWAEERVCVGGPHDGESAPPNAFITNVVKYRPPGNRTPDLREILHGAESLRKEWLAIGKPRLIVAVGATARKALSPVERAVIRPGSWDWLPDGKTALWVQFHPAYGLRQPRARADMERQWEAMGEWLRSQ